MPPTKYPGIDVRTGPRGTTYRARVRRAGVSHTRTFPTLHAALTWQAQMLDGATDPTAPPMQPPPPPTADSLPTPRRRKAVAPAPPTITALAQQLCRGMVVGTIRNRNGGPYKPSVVRKYEGTLRIDVLPRIGDEPVTAIQRGQLQRMVDELAVERSPEHARKALVAMRVLMRLADRDGLIDNDPCRGVRAPADPEPMRAARVLEPHEITAIIDAADQDDLRLGRSLGGPLLALLAFTGLRLGEALALPWGPEGVDLENRCLHVLRAVDRVRGLDGRFPFIPPKTRSSRRTVPIGADLTRRLVAHRARSRTPQDGELVFTELGQPLIPNSQPRRAFQRAVRDAGIHEPFPKLHDLRHAYASALLAAGLTVHAVAQLLGHSSPQLVMARYGHAYRTEVLSAADRLDALMAERGSRAA